MNEERLRSLEAGHPVAAYLVTYENSAPFAFHDQTPLDFCMLLLQLQPMCDDWDYLEDQHLLLAVKTADGLESYGEFSRVFICMLFFSSHVLESPYCRSHFTLQGVVLMCSAFISFLISSSSRPSLLLYNLASPVSLVIAHAHVLSLSLLHWLNLASSC